MRHRPTTVFFCLATILAALGAAHDRAFAQETAPESDSRALISEAADLASAGKSVEALDKAEAAYFSIWDLAPLAFRRVELIDGGEQSYETVVPRADNIYAAGQEIAVYVDPVGFGWREQGEEWETDLSADFILATTEGRIIAGQKNFGEFQIRTQRRTRDSFLVLNYQFSGVPAGDYVLTTTVNDRIDEETASFELPVVIR